MDGGDDITTVEMLEQQLKALKMQGTGGSAGSSFPVTGSNGSSPGYQHEGSARTSFSSLSPTHNQPFTTQRPLERMFYSSTTADPVRPPIAYGLGHNFVASDTVAPLPAMQMNGFLYPQGVPMPQQQEPRSVYPISREVQPTSNSDLWALNSVKPSNVGFNWFQAVSTF